MGPGDLIAVPRRRAGPGPKQQGLCRGRASAERPRSSVGFYAAHETSREGFDAEWRGIAVFTVEGELIDRTEVFDETDIDAAIARFEEHSTRSRNRGWKTRQAEWISAFRRASPPATGT